MNKPQIISLYDHDQRIDVAYPDMRREVMPNVVRQIDTSDTGEGMINYSQLNEANAEKSIHEQVSYIESIGQDFELNKKSGTKVFLGSVNSWPGFSAIIRNR